YPCGLERESERPLLLIYHERLRMQARQRAAINKMQKRAKILIVDDERSLRELLEIFLKKEGFVVVSAASAEEAMAQLKTTEFDLIISDIKMADMSGIDFLRELRKTTFNGQFILLTAFASAETAIQALKMGAFDYILKTENFMEELK